MISSLKERILHLVWNVLNGASTTRCLQLPSYRPRSPLLVTTSLDVRTCLTACGTQFGSSVFATDESGSPKRRGPRGS